MAKFVIRNNLNPNKAIEATITFRQIVNKGEEGEPVWVLQIATVEPHKDGGPITPTFIHYTDAPNLNAAIAEAVAELSTKVDWGDERTDTRAPFVIYHSPEDDGVVHINSNIGIGIIDKVPAAGIDIDSIKMTINGYDVTNDLTIEGTPLQYSVNWRPPLRVYDYE